MVIPTHKKSYRNSHRDFGMCPSTAEKGPLPIFVAEDAMSLPLLMNVGELQKPGFHLSKTNSMVSHQHLFQVG